MNIFLLSETGAISGVHENGTTFPNILMKLPDINLLHRSKKYGKLFYGNQTGYGHFESGCL
jgi:hypothetical protein